MAVTELNEDTQVQISDLLENLQQIEKLKNKALDLLLAMRFFIEYKYQIVVIMRLLCRFYVLREK